ncbi:hypothetical protein ACEUZ9_002730 [Paracoccus litorisediminis]|jgi:hypothetical protein|uniref:Transmembrane protein n=1 Tax=Paracoccus litorisediminis TaxID=2006130 RepID=A0A844HR60_9RHOB|nr:hypothetical protein [Paracoccus litorisediminis]MTH60914.1 hypothetical protein [Paracoccus litorisediminis]
MQSAETDYRIITQEYAKGAINASILINGGAAVAVLSQMANLLPMISSCSLAIAVLFFAFGVLSGLCAWTVGFLSTRYADRTLRKQEPDFALSDRYLVLGLICIVGCGVCFLFGVIVLAVGFIRP